MHTWWSDAVFEKPNPPLFGPPPRRTLGSQLCSYKANKSVSFIKSFDHPMQSMQLVFRTRHAIIDFILLTNSAQNGSLWRSSKLFFALWNQFAPPDVWLLHFSDWARLKNSSKVDMYKYASCSLCGVCDFNIGRICLPRDEPSVKFKVGGVFLPPKVYERLGKHLICAQYVDIFFFSHNWGPINY